jgi:hypothetical protein
LRDVFYLVLEFKDENQTFIKVEGPKANFFWDKDQDEKRPKRPGPGLV